MQISYLEFDHAVDVTAALKGFPMSGTPEPERKRGRPEGPIPKVAATQGRMEQAITSSIMAPEPSLRKYNQGIAGATKRRGGVGWSGA